MKNHITGFYKPEVVREETNVDNHPDLDISFEERFEIAHETLLSSSLNSDLIESEDILRLECDVCGAIFSDHELHDEDTWFNHKEKLFELKYKDKEISVYLYF